MDLAHCTTLLIDLTLEKCLQIWGERRAGRYVQKWHLHAVQNQRYLWNEAAYSQTYYRVCIETRVQPIDWWKISLPRVNFGLLFRRANFFSQRIYCTLSCRSATKFGTVRGPVNRHLFSEFRELWSDGRVISCDDIHQSFVDALVKWFFDKFPIFADSLCCFYLLHCPRIR